MDLINTQYRYNFVDTQNELEQFLDLIEENSTVAIDTEFERKDTYFPILSIVQIAYENTQNEKFIAIIDVLSNLDLSRFFAIIANPKIIKILHSSTQDLQIFYHIYKIWPENIFDTQIIANFCDQDYNVSLFNLVKNQCDFELNKAMQSSDWIKRPLSSSQIKYAINDVLFLHQIYKNFNNILRAKNRQDWAKEEMDNFIKRILQKDIEHIFKKFSKKGLNTLEIAKLYQIIQLREDYAKQLNVPREHLFKNEEIFQILKNNFKDFNKILLKTDFFKTLEEILINDKIIVDLKREVGLNETEIKQFDKIKSMVAKFSKKENIAPQFLVNSEMLKQIILAKNPKEILNNWRYSILGSQIQQILSLIK
ncbi:MAG: ribonuclease D [Rickettsiales bacterium]